MLTKTRGVVLHAIPYNDKNYIIHIYTEKYGRAAYWVARTTSKKTSLPRALFMPLSLIEMDVEHYNNRDLHRIREAKLSIPLNELFGNPMKTVIALFLSEVLYRSLKETEPDIRLFNYLDQSIRMLEFADDGIANFHLVFLLHLLNYLGILPNFESYKKNVFFDMRNGVFVEYLPSHKHFLGQQESEVLARLFRINFENMSVYSFSREQRVDILNRLIEYYQLHLPEFGDIKSLSILQTIFD